MLENGTNTLLDQVILWNMKLQFVKKKKKKERKKKNNNFCKVQ